MMKPGAGLLLTIAITLPAFAGDPPLRLAEGEVPSSQTLKLTDDQACEKAARYRELIPEIDGAIVDAQKFTSEALDDLKIAEFWGWVQLSTGLANAVIDVAGPGKILGGVETAATKALVTGAKSLGSAAGHASEGNAAAAALEVVKLAGTATGNGELKAAATGASAMTKASKDDETGLVIDSINAGVALYGPVATGGSASDAAWRTVGKVTAAAAGVDAALKGAKGVVDTQVEAHVIIARRDNLVVALRQQREVSSARLAHFEYTCSKMTDAEAILAEVIPADDGSSMLATAVTVIVQSAADRTERSAQFSARAKQRALEMKARDEAFRSSASEHERAALSSAMASVSQVTAAGRTTTVPSATARDTLDACASAQYKCTEKCAKNANGFITDEACARPCGDEYWRCYERVMSTQ